MSSLRPQTIQIFLPDGNPRSVRIAELTNRVVKAVLVPRNKMDYITTRDELRNVGVYFLFSTDEERSRPTVYIGEAEDCLDRLRSHNRNKEFWSHAVVMISKINAFTKSHVKFLESIAVEKAKQVNRFDTENANIPTRSFVTESMEADLMDSFVTMGILLSTLGYPIFDELARSSVNKKEVLYLSSTESSAQGDLVDDGFVVFKGAKARVKETDSFHNYMREIRVRMIKEDLMIRQDEHYVFQKDQLFKSPSTAAAIVLGRNANGWREWKDKNGKTLDELKRQN
jgi:hypothetical protein